MTMANRRKTSRPPSSSAWGGWVLAALLAVGVGVGIAWWIVAAQGGRDAPLRVQVTLVNRCELIDAAFMVVSEPDGSRATFDRGVAFLDTRKSSRVYLTVNDRFPGFQFESPKKSAAPQVVLTAECGLSDRVDRTIDAMREQFRVRDR
jgi:hypothetical protein